MKVEFEGEQYRPTRQTSHAPSAIIGLAIKLGIVKNATQANIFLVVFILILAAISFIFIRTATEEEVPEGSFVPAVTEEINTP